MRIRSSSRALPLRATGRRYLLPAGVALASLVLLTQAHAAPALPGGPALASSLSRPAVTTTEARSAYGKLPLAFVANAGQTDRRVRFSAQAGGASFWFTKKEAVFSFAGKRKGHVLRLQFLGANPAPAIDGSGRAPGTANYLLGNDPAKWHTGISTYEEVVYRDLWPGIDMAFRGQGGTLKYEFRLAPGADPRRIRLAYRGAQRLSLGRGGQLVIGTAMGPLRDSRPISFQRLDGRRVSVASRFRISGASYGFALGAFERSQPLVIDPGLAYSTYLGGNFTDSATDIAVDTAHDAYVTGRAASNFPTTAGAFDNVPGLSGDAFVTKLNASGTALVYSTFLGGSSDDFGAGIAIDSSGNAYVTGQTTSTNFPTTPGALATGAPGIQDAFVTKLNPTGSALVYSTYLGGSSIDEGLDIAVDAAGSAYVTGVTGSDNMSLSFAAQRVNGGGLDAFVTKINPAGSLPVYSTYVGGSSFDQGSSIAVDAAGDAYVTGQTHSTNFPTTPGAVDTSAGGSADAFLTKITEGVNNGSSFVYSTYLGGSGQDDGRAIALDASGNAYIAGQTFSTNFPTTAGAFDTSEAGGDAFVTKVNATATGLIYSTFLGGSQATEGAFGIAVDGSGSAYVTGETQRADFPTTPGAFDPSYNGSIDAFVTKLNGAGSDLLYSSYLGGAGIDQGLGIAVDGAGSAYVTGDTFSADFPTTPGAFDTSYNGSSDAFVTKLVIAAAPATLVLTPPADTNPVGTSHTVTATVTDAGGSPIADVIVRFTVTGSVSASGSCTTDAAGQCAFSYTGPQLPGAASISAYADSDSDGVQDAGEPAGEAAKAWILPFSTPGQVSGGGTIADAQGNKIAFGFSAKSGDKGLSGQCNVVDNAADVMVKCVDVTAIVQSGNTATIFGNATANGVATTYRIDAVDNADPGKDRDVFSIQTASGYSRSGVLTNGSVQVK